MAPPTELPPRTVPSSPHPNRNAILLPRPSHGVVSVSLTSTSGSDSQSVTTDHSTHTGGDVSALTTTIDSRIVNYRTPCIMFNLKQIITQHLFPKIKFIASKSDLEFSTDNQSIAQIILTNFNNLTDPLQQMQCWAQIRSDIPLFMNRKRTAINLAIKNKFKGMSMRLVMATHEPTTHINSLSLQHGLRNTMSLI